MISESFRIISCNLPKASKFSGTYQRWVHTTSRLLKTDDRKNMMRTVPKKDEGIGGATMFKEVDIARGPKYEFPDENTPNMLIGDTRFSELPICHVAVSKNNTKMMITDHKGIPYITRSCGMEGFKNTKKGTNIAAQATGIGCALRAIEKGFKTLRLVISGLGPGRMASVKGLQMGGVEIVSITDNTPIPTRPRPRKQRRI